MQIPTIARQQFDAIVSDGEAAAIAYVKSLVSSKDRTFEGQYLEFKTGRVHKPGELWSKALSAFGNTDGGVVIWGVKTTSDNGVDYATDIEQVPNALSLKGELDKHLQGATDPPISGVETRPFPSDGQPGFVVCLIPSSPYKPHRALLCTGHPYYARMGHRNDEMPAAWLRRLFYPERSVRLAAQLELVAPNADNRYHWRINCTLFNVGYTTAEAMYVESMADFWCNFNGMDGCGREYEWDEAKNTILGSDGSAGEMEVVRGATFRCPQPLHPGSSIVPFHCVNLKASANSDLRLRVTVYSRDQAPLSVTVAVPESICETVARQTKDGSICRIPAAPPALLLPQLTVDTLQVPAKRLS